jgi:hypothetical protein
METVWSIAEVAGGGLGSTRWEFASGGAALPEHAVSTLTENAANDVRLTSTSPPAETA